MALREGRRSRSSFTVQRSQILLKSSNKKPCKVIASELDVCIGTVCSAINAFHREGLKCLTPKPPGRKNCQRVLDGENQEKLRRIALQSPRNFGKPRSTWTLPLLAEVCFEEGVTPSVLSHESIRQGLLRLSIRFTKAKAWISSPDPSYDRKKGGVTG